MERWFGGREGCCEASKLCREHVFKGEARLAQS